MLRRIHSILLLIALLIGSAGMNYVQAAKYVITVRSNPTTAGKVQVGSYAATTSSTYQYASPTTLTVKAIPNTGYKFVNWSNGSTSTNSSISVNLANNNGKTFVANFTIKTYTITFKNADGTTLQTLTVNHGATPSYSGSTPTQASTAQYSYTFKGWDKTIAAATADATYTATYTATTRSYTIKFVNNGTTLQSSTLQYGATPSYTGSTPTKTATAQYTYTFSGWSPTIAKVTGNATYTAQFSQTVRSYTIRFLNGSTVLQSSSVKYGTTPSYTGATPTKSATVQYTYTFSSWSPTIYAVNKAQDYTAQFTSTVRSYKITGASDNTTMGTVSGTATKQYGQTVTLTATPKGCYRFKQWNDGNTDNPRTVTVTGTATYTATFEQTTYVGYCGATGNSVIWTINICSGLLTITGTGEMKDYNGGQAPCYNYREDIKSIVINSGVTCINRWAFVNCTNLTTVNIANSVKQIRDYAFYGCSSLTSITIPSGVTTIGSNGAIVNCDNLKDIYVSWTTSAAIPTCPTTVYSGITLHVPCGTTQIYKAKSRWQNYTIEGNTQYTITAKSPSSTQGTVSIDGGTASTSVNKTTYCDNTVKLTATPNGCYHFTQWSDGNTDNPRTVTVSGTTTYNAQFSNTFSGNCGATGNEANVKWSLNTCTGAFSITGTGAMADYNDTSVPWFSYRKSITSVTIANGVTCIGNYAFYNCTNLSSVSIGTGVTRIGNDAFHACSGLSSVTIPNKVTTIGDYAFLYCALTTITIPSSVTEIGAYAFWMDATTDIYVAWTTAEAIPAWHNLTYDFGDRTLHIPCGSGEFYRAANGWNSLKIQGLGTSNYTLTVTANDNLGTVQIDDDAEGTTVSKSVHCEDTHTITATHNPSAGCYHFKQWSDGNTDNPRTVGISANTTFTAEFVEGLSDGSCGTDATFVLSCDSVLTISGTGTISNSAFNRNTAIKSVVIEEGITGIGAYAFAYCTNMEHITFPSTMTDIGGTNGHVFYCCYKLKSIYIPASVTNIGRFPLLRCNDLEIIQVDPANTVYDSRSNCNAIIETATNKMIAGCMHTVMPHTTEIIDQFCFEYLHKLKSMLIASSVHTFNGQTFKECENLKDIYVEWTENIPVWNSVTYWSEHSSDNLDPGITLHVPCGKKAMYEAATGWKKYNIVDDHLKGGICGINGSNLTWMLSCDGVLTIRGSGAMEDFVYSGGTSTAEWFDYREAVKTVFLTDEITSIGENAFADFTNLTDIYAPWTENIPVLPASNNPQASVTLHVPCSAIKEYQEADGWKNYTVTTEYTASGTCGAEGDNLTWTLCDGVLTISGTGEMANWTYSDDAPWYSYRETITSVIIEDGVTRIGNYAFYSCSNLTTITIPPSVTSIGMGAFFDCYAMESLYITDLAAWCNINFAWDGAFPFYSNSDYGEGNLYVNGTKVTTLTIPDGITVIPKRAFMGFAGITDIQFNQVTTIDQSAFVSCRGLTDVTIPEGVTLIDAHAFSYCTNLQSISLPATANNSSGILIFTMNDCPALTDIYVHWTENIPMWMLMTNKSPQSSITLHVPCGTEELYNAASGWNGYTIVDEMLASGTCGAEGDNLTWTLCNGILTISGTGAMANYPAMNMPWKDYRTSITSVIISEGVTTIGDDAFNGCSHLASLTVPPSLTSVGQNAFTSCWAMESLYITDLAAWCNIDFGTYDSSPFSRNGYSDYVGGDLYVNGTKVTTLTIPDGITEIKHDAFYGFAGITDIQFNQVTTIGKSAFDGCHGLTEVTIPEGVTAIGQYGFCYCSHLQSISIPASVSSLGTSMLAADNMLTDIYVHWTENVPDRPSSFTTKSPQSSITLHVPCGAEELYNAASGWNGYTPESEGGPFIVTVQAEDPTMGDVSITVNP